MILPRTILKQDLAVKLYPQSSNVSSAMQLLRKEIKLSPELTSKLDLLARNKRVHYYTHKQLELILEHIGISKEEFVGLYKYDKTEIYNQSIHKQ